MSVANERCWEYTMKGNSLMQQRSSLRKNEEQRQSGHGRGLKILFAVAF